MQGQIPAVNEDREHILKGVRCFALDMDGTIYLGEQWIDGALEFLHKIEETGRSYVFVTNNSSKNAAVYVDKLHRMGLEVGEDKIVTSGQATIYYLQRHFPGAKVFLLGNPLLREEFMQAGIMLEEEQPDVVVPVRFGVKEEVQGTYDGTFSYLSTTGEDLTSIERAACECGRTLPRIQKFTGRTDDMKVIRGVNVFPTQVETALLSMGGGVAPHYMLIVDRENNLDVLTVMVEVDEKYFSDEIRRLDGLKAKVGAVLKQALGVSVRVKLVEPKTIQRSEGKAKRVIDNREL